MKFQQIRSATAIVEFGGVRILVDPWLAPKETLPPIPGSPNPDLRCPIHDLPASVEEILNGIDAVLATHLHFDHFDQTAIDAIPKETPILAQDEKDAATLRGYGFRRVIPLKYGGIDFRGIELFKTGCHHGIPGVVEKLYEAIEMRGQACGVVFRSQKEDKTLYLAGDTIWCDYVENAIRLHKPDAIVVNAACASIKECGRIIMGLEDIRAVLNATPDAIVVASHMDEVGHSTLWRKDIRKFVRDNALEARLLIPDDGETLEF